LVEHVFLSDPALIGTPASLSPARGLASDRENRMAQPPSGWLISISFQLLGGPQPESIWL